MKSKLLLVLLTAVVFIQGCDSDKGSDTKKYEHGVLIVNEGAFGGGNGTVTFLDPSSGKTTENIFKNSEGFAGDVLQSLTISNDDAYLVLNGDNKVEVANQHTFLGEHTLTAAALDKPRYIEVINGKAYISVWGAYDENYSLINSYVLVMNAQTLQVVDTIDTDEGTENLLYDGAHLFASNYNFGASSTVAVIDPTDNSLVKNVDVGAGPSGMVLDKNNKLWVIVTGTYHGNDGKLVRINPATFEIEGHIDLGVNPGSDLAISKDKSQLIYSAGKNIYKVEISAETAPSEAFITNNDVVTPYALGVDPTTGDIYFGDALNYATAGTVYVYNASGALTSTVTSGICPTQFVFKE